MTAPRYHLTAGLLCALVVCGAATLRAQGAGDEVLATWHSGPTGTHESLQRTSDGFVVFRRSDDTKEPDFYVRETVALSAVDSLTIDVKDHEEYEGLNGVYITVFTKDAAILREHHTGGEEITRHTSEAIWIFEPSQKELAKSVFARLKTLTGK